MGLRAIGPYTIEGSLGVGGMGRVFRAVTTHAVGGLEPGTTVALKVLHPHLLETESFRQRFRREAELGQRVVHENVVRTLAGHAFEDDGVPHHALVMEYVQGQTVRSLLDDLGVVPEELCRHIGREIGKGLAAIHGAGAVHRDLKPENVLITRDHRVKVMDLGVAWLQDAAIRLSRTGHFVGSVQYAAPEAFQGTASIDGRSDLHALGILLYELATGSHPYHHDDPKVLLHRILHDEPRRAGAVNPQLSAFFEETIHCLVQKDPEDRFPSAAELVEVLEGGERSAWWHERARQLRQETQRPLRRIRIPRDTAVYGRDEDLASLRSAYERAKSGEGQVILLEGEAGIGKTRLVDEMVHTLVREGEDLNFLFGSYPPGGAATAAGAISTAYREHLGHEDLDETLAKYLLITPILAPALAALLRGEPPPPDAERLTPDSLKTVFIHLTHALAQERPTVVLIDDLHFAPKEGRALFAALAFSLAEHRVVLIGSMRPGASDDWASHVAQAPNARLHGLRRLGPKDLAQLLEDTFRSRRLADELGMQIARKSDGNPFFAFEIIRGLREGELITRQPDGSWSTTQLIREIEVPSAVRDLVTARVSDLEQASRDLLDLASCCGFRFDPLLVAETLGEEPLPVLKALARIERGHQLVRAAGEAYVFDHHQVQEALYESLSEPLRRAYHQSIAEALERRSGAREKEPEALGGKLCVELCEHFLAGTDEKGAARYVPLALQHLINSYLNERAERILDRALAIDGLLEGEVRLDSLMRRVRILDRAGRREAQAEVIEEASRLAATVSNAYLATSLEGEHGNLCLRRGQSEAALVHYQRQLALAKDVGTPHAEAAALGNVANALLDLGRSEEALEVGDRCCALFREVGVRDQEAVATSNLGAVLMYLGRVEEAVASFERAREAAAEAGHRTALTLATGNLGYTAILTGHYADALHLITRHLQLARETGDRRAESLATGNLGRACLLVGQHDRARELLDACEAMTREMGFRHGTGYVLTSRVWLAEHQGRLAGALELARENLALREGLSMDSETAESLITLGRLELETGNSDAAHEHLERAVEIAAEAGDAHLLMLATAHASRLPEGDTERAHRALDTCAQDPRIPDRLEATCALWKATEDEAVLRDAKHLAQELLERAPPTDRQAMREKVPVMRELLGDAPRA